MPQPSQPLLSVATADAKKKADWIGRLTAGRLNCSETQAGHLRTLLSKLEYRSQNGQATVSERQLAYKWRRVRTVRATIAWAEELDVLTVRRRRGCVSVYHIHWRGVWAIGEREEPGDSIDWEAERQARLQAAAERPKPLHPPQFECGKNPGKDCRTVRQTLSRSAANFAPYLLTTNCSSSSATDCPADDWEKMKKKLVEVGMAQPERCLDAARDAGASPQQVQQLIRIWQQRRGANTLGALYVRIRDLSPGEDPTRRWPAPLAPEPSRDRPKAPELPDERPPVSPEVQQMVQQRGAKAAFLALVQVKDQVATTGQSRPP